MLKSVFFGTAPLARASLAALVASDFVQVLAVVTQPDRPQGRELKLTPSPVKALALELGLPVLQPARARDPDFVAQLRQIGPDVIVVAAYGQILPPAILDLPPLGCVNVHASLLPKYRGAAPIQWAILHDDRETGVTLMKMDAGLDTGPILAQAVTPIHAEDDAQTLHDRLAALGARLLVETLPRFAAGQVTPRPQPAAGGSYARKITKADGRIDWTKPARALWNQVRAFTPWPGSYTFLPGTGERRLLKVWAAAVEPEGRGEPGQVLCAARQDLVVACGEGALRLLALQREGGKRLGTEAFLAGLPLRVGDRLG